MVYTVAVPFPKSAIEKKLEEIRDEGNVPLGLLVYAVADDRLDLLIISDQNPEEIQALLEKFKIGIKQVR